MSDETLYRIRRANGWMAFFSMVVAATAVGGAYVLWQQLGVMQDQLDSIEEMSDQVKGALESDKKQSADLQVLVKTLTDRIDGLAVEANRQARSAEKASAVVSQALLALNRPWLAVESISAANVLQINRALAIKVTVRNSGRGPALKVRAFFQLETTSKGVAVPSVRDCESCIASTVMPNGLVAYDVSIDPDLLSREKVTAVKQGEESLTLIGKIDYSDIGEKPHATELCRKYVPQRAIFTDCEQGDRLD